MSVFSGIAMGISGGLGVLGAIAQRQALSRQAEIEREAAQLRIGFQREQGTQELARNRLLMDEVDAQIAAAAAARGVSGTSGSVEDLERANAISGGINEALINANVRRAGFEPSTQFLSRLQNIRNRRRTAVLGAFGSVASTAARLGEMAE